MIPDLEFFFEDLNLHNLSYVDVFYFHGAFDWVIPENDLFVAGELLLIFVVVNVLSIALTVESFQVLKTALFGEKEEEDEEEGIEEGKEGESEIGEEKDEEVREENEDNSSEKSSES